MQLLQPTKNLFEQLKDVMLQMPAAQYTQPVEILFKATIGQHCRHIIELFIELNIGYETGIVNYEKRKRNHLIEMDRFFAMQQLDEILATINKPDKTLQLITDYVTMQSETVEVTTNYYRELIYNIEHTVHHMALIRTGINEVSQIAVPAEFGVAASTIKHRNTLCAQ